LIHCYWSPSPAAFDRGGATPDRRGDCTAAIAAWQLNEDWIRHRLVLTPHSAFYTPESMRDSRAFASRTSARYLRDRRLENCVNKQFLAARG
jgi:hypothetical protein